MDERLSLWVTDFECSMTVEAVTGSYACCKSGRHNVRNGAR